MYRPAHLDLRVPACTTDSGQEEAGDGPGGGDCHLRGPSGALVLKLACQSIEDALSEVLTHIPYTHVE